ncbi:hypothetical protein ACGTJS_12690 [Faucicola mancuniensis]|uniref:hypothetical protein n=1 Tax=Faucicola mancuniensis TaxID=1309795 RepID=UPI00397741EB
MSDSFLFFTNKYITECEVMHYLNNHSYYTFESMDFPNNGADFFVMYNNYKCSFSTEIMLISKTIDCNYILQLFKDFAKKFSCLILTESYSLINSNAEYIVIDDNGSIFNVDIIEMYDDNKEFLGLNIVENSMMLLRNN